MIRYALICDAEHAFEGWFGDSADFDVQRKRGLLSCPLCDSQQVRKQIMAPAVAGTRKTERPAPGVGTVMMDAMHRLRAHVEESFDYVGDRFAEEARAIHAGRAEARGVYGEAGPDEVKALIDDGVPVAPLPPAAPGKTEIN